MARELIVRCDWCKEECDPNTTLDADWRIGPPGVYQDEAELCLNCQLELQRNFIRAKTRRQGSEDLVASAETRGVRVSRLGTSPTSAGSDD